MFVKSGLPSALAGALLTSVVSGASIPRFEVAADQSVPDVVFAPTQPLHEDYLANAKQNLDLTTEDSFYWSHEDQGMCYTSHYTICVCY